MAYRRYYRRPSFSRSSYRSRGFNPAGAILVLLAIPVLFIFGIIASIASNPALASIFGLAIFVGLIYLIVKGIQKILRWINPPAESPTTSISQKNLLDINSEKHGCKCYMEGLTYGEQEVADTLSRELSYKDYFIFNNLIIPSENNGSTQIDHIVVSRYGIFVLESKDYKGWIFGDRDGQSWTQSLPGGRVKNQFQNPIHQNYAHIAALRALMPFGGENMYSIVVFTDKSEIKSVPIENVVHLSQLIQCIKKYTEPKLSEADVQMIIGKLSYACQTVDITPAEHIANLQASHL